ncbi:hypothetical protein [Roseimicrobium sp. ORNL1]|uniref:hypothetical protein n=1 Tax=Roseimicrobium sp. ORNL1 TaxID=2711231 RepID=UPI0013E16FE2|nr:hypothetical protein [Roseimicrobium sp. ORNL1]QIF03604.1 hypothetical protein G5S37_19445 [Roseimicrobium sp. ORNL1]
MPEILCSHCQQPIDAAAPRRGNMITCTSCKGEVYVPQVQHALTREEKAAARGQSNNGKRGYQPSKKASRISTEGIGITLIVLCMFLVGGSIVVGGGYLVYYLNKQREEAQVNRLKQEEEEALAKKKAEEEEAKARLLEMALDPTEQDIRSMRKANETLSLASREAEEQYNVEVKAAGFHRLLTPDRLAADKDFSQSHKIVRDVREAFNKHRTTERALLEQFVKDLEAIEYESIPKDIFMARIRASRASVYTQQDEIWNLKSDVIERYAQAIGHLEKTQGKWVLEGTDLAFNDAKDAEQYRKFFDEMELLTKKAAAKSQAILDDMSADEFASRFNQ